METNDDKARTKVDQSKNLDTSTTTVTKVDIDETAQKTAPEDYVDGTKGSATHIDHGASFRENGEPVWTQTGFRRALFPFVLYLLVLATLVGIHVLLTILTILYYVQQGAVTILPMVFQSDVQVLKAFEIAWGVGFAFSLVLQWPYSLDSLFLRRSLLSNATHVAVFTPQKTTIATKSNSSSRIAKMQQALALSFSLFTRLMALLFCDIRRTKIPGKTVFVPVEVDQEGTRFFFFRYRRYNFDPDQDKFVPGIWAVGNSIGDFLDAATGLPTEQEVIRRRGAVGPNSIRLTKPNLFRCIYQEFCKPFYTYQAFMVWTWP